MAISDNRIEIEEIANISTVDFNNTEDVVGDTVAKIASYTNGITNSVFNRSTNKKSNNPSDTSLGIFNNNPCDLLKGGNGFTSKEYATWNNRDLFSKFTLDCAPSTNSVDNLLKMLSKETKGFNYVTPNGENRLGSMISGISKEYTSKPISDLVSPDKLDKLVKNNIAKALNLTGGTIKSKLKLMDLLNPCSNGDSSIDLGFDLSELLNMLSLAGLLESIKCMGPEAMVNFMANSMNITDTNKSTIVSALTNNLNKDNVSSITNELSVLSNFVTSSDDPTDLVRTKGISNKVLNSIKNNPTNTNSAVSEYRTITESLDIIDSSWDKDDDGNVNYYKVANNSTMGSLSESKLLNKYDTTTTYDGTHTTTVDRPVSITILNKTKRPSITLEANGF